MSDEFMSFGETLGILGLPEGDLKRLVSEGEIRAFRDKGETIFKKEDVRALRDALSHQPIIVSSSEGVPAGAEPSAGPREDFEETVLNIEGLGEIDLGEEMGPRIDEIERPAAPPEEEPFATLDESAERTTRIEDEKKFRDTIKMEETAVPEGEEAFVLSESDLGNETESLELLDDTSTVLEGPAEAAGSGAPRAAFAPAGLVFGEGVPTDKLTLGMLAVTVIVMILGFFASLGLLLQQSNAILDLFR